jgi:hypothetical protein
MKILSLILISLLVSSLQLKAQTQDLLDNTWYLEKVVINDESFFVPETNIVEYAEFFDNSMESQSSCNFLWSDLEYSLDNTNFSMINFGLTLEGCTSDDVEIDEEIAEFQKSYLIDFFNYPSSDFNNPFTYEITEESSTLKKLTITNTNDDQAVYYSETLSTNDVNGFGSVQLYPNPVASHFSVESQLVLQQIRVYNELGQVVLEFFPKASKTSYDISILAKGIYFVELSSSEGKKTLKKLIKN